MGFFKGLVCLTLAPVSIVAKTLDSVLNEDIELADVVTLGATKVIKATVETASDLDDIFEE